MTSRTTLAILLLITVSVAGSSFIFGIFSRATGSSVAAHAQSGGSLNPCGKGTIAFASPPRANPPAPPLQCLQGDFYAEGKRSFVANLMEPVGSHFVTLVLIHVQEGNGAAGGQNLSPQGGLLFSKQLRVANPKATVIRGSIDFSSVYSQSGPAGGPPFGQYFLSIYRDRARLDPLLAVGEFDVTED